MNKKESKALIEVWDWKEKAYQEVKHLDLKDAILQRLKQSEETSVKLGFQTKKLVMK